MVDEPSNRLRIQGQPVRKNSISEDFWSTSTIDMDNSAILSQISITSNNPLDAHGASSTSNTSEFVNHGIYLINPYICICVLGALSLCVFFLISSF